MRYLFGISAAILALVLIAACDNEPTPTTPTSAGGTPSPAQAPNNPVTPLPSNTGTPAAQSTRRPYAPIDWTTELYDVVALKVGPSLTGTIESLVGEQLGLKNQGNVRPVRRDDVSFVLFDTDKTYALPGPPSDYDGTKDLIFLRDTGAVKIGKVSAITQANVFSDVGVFSRDMVIEIVFGSSPGGTKTPGGEGGPPEDTHQPTPPGTHPPSPPPTSGTPQPLPTNSDQNLAQACPVDKPLGAWVEHNWDVYSSEGCSTTFHQLSWFRLVPDPNSGARSWSDALRFGFTATELNYRWVMEDCVDNPGDSETCTGQRNEVTGKVSVGSGVDQSYVKFYPLVPSLDLRLPGEVRMESPVTCLTTNNTNTGAVITQGDIVNISARSCDSAMVCTPPTVCEAIKDPAVQKDCLAHPERYAAIPYNGDFPIVQNGLPGANVAEHASVKWAVCCGCGESAPNLPGPQKTTLPSNEGPTPTQDACGPPVNEQAQIDRLSAIRQQYVDQLKSLWPEFEEHLNETKDNVEAYRAAIGACGIEEIGQEVLTFYVGENGGKAGEATTKFIGVTQKLMDGDWSFLLPKNEEKGQEYDVEQAWDVIRNIWSGMGAGSPEGMRVKLEDCPALPDNLREAALKFVDNMQAYLEMMPQLQKLVNNVRQIDLESWNWQFKLHQGCVQYQECRGLDTSSCPKIPDGSP